MIDLLLLNKKKEELKLALGNNSGMSEINIYAMGCEACDGACEGNCEDTCSGRCTGCGSCGSNQAY